MSEARACKRVGRLCVGHGGDVWLCLDMLVDRETETLQSLARCSGSETFEGRFWQPLLQW